MDAPQGHSKPCEFCGEPCDGFAGNPSRWPSALYSATPGKVGWWHMGCASSRIRRVDRLEVALRIIAGREPCADNLMGNVDVAIAALDN